MGNIQILKTGITSLDTDALVNAANEGLLEGGGVCGIIFQAAGSRELQAACNAIGGCKTGSAVITPGFNLKSKYIIHAVGPRWTDGKHNEPKLLYSAYKQSLILAAQNGCKSIGFPLISAGIFGYPVDKAWRKAVQACLDFQNENPEADLDIRFAVIDDNILNIGKKTLTELKKERTTLFLKDLDADGLRQIKQKISQNAEMFIDRKAHPVAGGLMTILNDAPVLSVLTADHLVKMIDLLFPEYVLEESWIEKYSDLLLRTVDQVKYKTPEGRAQKYDEYMKGDLIQELRKGAHSGYVSDDLDALKNYYKTVVCLFRYYVQKEKAFAFRVDRESMDDFNRAIIHVKGTGKQVLGIVVDPVKAREAQYATFLSWILEELLLKEETI